MKVSNFLMGFLFCLLALGLLAAGIDKPFTGHHDDNNSYYAQVAQNYIRYGIVPLRFGQLIGRSTPQSRNFYTHHPPLLSISLAAGLVLFGDNFTAVRLVPVLFSAATVLVFYLFLRRFFDVTAAVLAIGFLLITPMFMYFGKMADHEAPTLFFIILSLYLYSRLPGSGRSGRFRWLLLSLFFGQWFGWPAYYLAGLLFLLTRRWEILALSVFNFILFLAAVYWQTGSLAGGGLGEILLFRTGAGRLPGITESYTNIQLATQELRWLYHFFTPPQFLISAVAFGASAYLWFKNRRMSIANKIWLVFFAVAVIHVVLFRTGAWRHDYWLYYFLPFFAWGIASAVELSRRHFPRARNYIALAGLCLFATAIFQSQPFFWALQNMVVK